MSAADLGTGRRLAERRVRDDSVEAVFEGDAVAVDAAVAWCRHGPPRARVDEVTVVDEDGAFEGLRSFRIVGGD